MKYLIIAATLFLSSAPQAQAKGQFDVGVLSSIGLNTYSMSEWNHRNARRDFDCMCYAPAPDKPEAVKPLDAQVPIPYLNFNFSRAMDPYMWIFNRAPDPKPIQWFRKGTQADPWPMIVGGIASALIAGAVMLTPFAMLKANRDMDKDFPV